MLIRVFHPIFSFRIISKFYLIKKGFFICQVNYPKNSNETTKSQNHVFHSGNKLQNENTKIHLIKNWCGINWCSNLMCSKNQYKRRNMNNEQRTQTDSNGSPR